jgi:hypothetical protein
MFEPGTILRLREPQSTDDKPYPYDLVKVIGQSPIQHSRPDADSPFAGQDAVGYVITPAGDAFGPTLDKPYGELAEHYEIEAYPTDPVTGEDIKPENNPRNVPSPEQVFAKLAREQAAEPRRPRTPALQADAKSPEQVLREAVQAEKQESRRAKPKEEKGE